MSRKGGRGGHLLITSAPINTASNKEEGYSTANGSARGSEKASWYEKRSRFNIEPPGMCVWACVYTRALSYEIRAHIPGIRGIPRPGVRDVVGHRVCHKPLLFSNSIIRAR